MLKTYVAAVLLAVPAAAATRPFTAKDLASIERVSSPSILPTAATLPIVCERPLRPGNHPLRTLGPHLLARLATRW